MFMCCQNYAKFLIFTAALLEIYKGKFPDLWYKKKNMTRVGSREDSEICYMIEVGFSYDFERYGCIYYYTLECACACVHILWSVTTAAGPKGCAAMLPKEGQSLTDLVRKLLKSAS